MATLAIPDAMAGPPAGYPEFALEEARTWLARELHDGAVQRLTLAVVELEGMRRRPGAGPELERVQHSVRAALHDLRRLLFDLRDEPATDAHFVETVRDLLSELAAETGIQAELTVRSWPEDLPSHRAVNLRRIVGEALSNVRRHSGATCVAITLQAVGGSLAITITDNGRGIASKEDGFGLRGMSERARLVGGRISLDSAPRRGTTVRCLVPYGEPQ